MGAKQRVYRSRIDSTTSLKKIFSAMELIATSRIAKARAQVNASKPYAKAITRAVSAVAWYANLEHPLIKNGTTPQRAAVVFITSDRGMAGAYSSNVLRAGEELIQNLAERDVEAVPYLVGRKAQAYFRFRGREAAGTWSGFSDAPSYADAQEVSDTVLQAFLKDSSDGGVDEIYVVHTQFVNMVTQRPEVIRLLPLEIVEGVSEPDPDKLLPLYEFEPNAEEVLDALLPKYIHSRMYSLMLESSASEHAARQRAMKTASDNAQDLIRTYTRLANQARQAEITQEISEIVGGVDALASAGQKN